MDSETLTSIRSALGLTQSALGARLGVNDRTVSKWERGIHRIPQSVVIALNSLQETTMSNYTQHADGTITIRDRFPQQARGHQLFIPFVPEPGVIAYRVPAVGDHCSILYSRSTSRPDVGNLSLGVSANTRSSQDSDNRHTENWGEYEVISANIVTLTWDDDGTTFRQPESVTLRPVTA